MRNVTTIVGLRAYSAQSNILPEQTLGRGLRKMYPGGVEEYVSVVGTNAFMDFVESIQAEGVVLERKPMGEGTQAKTPLVVEIDRDNAKKDIDALDIEIPVLTPRIYREYKNLKDLRLVSGYDVLYGKVKAFVQNELFDRQVELESPNTLRNLSEPAATKTVLETFKKAINALTVQDKGDAEIRDTIKLRQTRPFVAKDQGYLIPKKSVFNKIIGDKGLELSFARFLEDCDDVVSYAKNYMAVHFKLDYVNADGDISNYYPDFLVKLSARRIFIVETKGLEDLDVPLKMQRLRQWCEDINRVQADVVYDFVYVDWYTTSYTWTRKALRDTNLPPSGNWWMGSGNTKRNHNPTLARHS